MVQNIQIGDAPFYFPLGTVWKLFDTIGAGFIRLFMEKKFNYSVFFPWNAVLYSNYECGLLFYRVVFFLCCLVLATVAYEVLIASSKYSFPDERNPTMHKVITYHKNTHAKKNIHVC